MFANYDYSNFPYVLVSFNEIHITYDAFQCFLNTWWNLYEKKKDFIFIFDTSQLILPPIQYCFYMSMFIKKLRALPYQYLKKSYIHIDNPHVLYFLNLIFTIQSPVAPIYVTYDSIDTIINNTSTINVVKTFEANCSLIPFL